MVIVWPLYAVILLIAGNFDLRNDGKVLMATAVDAIIPLAAG